MPQILIYLQNLPFITLATTSTALILLTLSLDRENRRKCFLGYLIFSAFFAEGISTLAYFYTGFPSGLLQSIFWLITFIAGFSSLNFGSEQQVITHQNILYRLVFLLASYSFFIQIYKGFDFRIEQLVQIMVLLVLVFTQFKLEDFSVIQKVSRLLIATSIILAFFKFNLPILSELYSRNFSIYAPIDFKYRLPTWVLTGQDYRFRGLFNHPIACAFALSVAIIVLLPSKFLRDKFYVFLGLFLVTLTGARISLAALILVFGLYYFGFFARPEKVRGRKFIGYLVVPSITLVIWWYLFNSDRSLNGRLENYIAALGIFRQNLFLGAGASFQNYFTENSILSIGVRSGLVAILLLLTIYIILIKNLLPRNWSHNSSPELLTILFFIMTILEGGFIGEEIGTGFIVLAIISVQRLPLVKNQIRYLEQDIK